MNYSLLKKRIKESRITFRECAVSAGMTEQGLRKALEGERLTVSSFENLCRILGDSPLIYLDSCSCCITGNQNQIGGISNSLSVIQENAEVSALKQRIADLEKIISTQEKTIELLTNLK